VPRNLYDGVCRGASQCIPARFRPEVNDFERYALIAPVEVSTTGSHWTAIGDLEYSRLRGFNEAPHTLQATQSRTVGTLATSESQREEEFCSTGGSHPLWRLHVRLDGGRRLAPQAALLAWIQRLRFLHYDKSADMAVGWIRFWTLHVEFL
jgi:hypothetical protein